MPRSRAVAARDQARRNHTIRMRNCGARAPIVKRQARSHARPGQRHEAQRGVEGSGGERHRGSRARSGGQRRAREHRRRAAARTARFLGGEREELGRSACRARCPPSGRRAKPARRSERPRRRRCVPAVPVAAAVRPDPRRRARLRERERHRGGGRARRTPRGSHQRRRRRCSFRAFQLVVAPRGRRAASPLGGVHGREGHPAHSFARLGRAAARSRSHSRRRLPSPA